MAESVIDTLSAAVEASPDSLPLRLHLLSLLLTDQQYARAFQGATYILSLYPAHLEALSIAAQAAEGQGEGAKAVGYRQLYSALQGVSLSSTSPSTMPPTLLGNVDAPLPDERLREYAWNNEDEGPLACEVESSNITLADVAGMEAVKKRLRVAFLEPMRNPELRKLYGRSLRGGLLMYGPPGCGKTYIARAIAGELGAGFISVGLSDVLDMYIGNSEKNLHALFQTARASAPCVLFFDEVDALGRKRSHMRGSGANVINQLLSELDSVNASNEGVFTLAATNSPWDVDSALRRPGRLDRTLLVLPPDDTARRATLELHLRGRPVERLDLPLLARRTDGYSGADLAHLVESAAENAMEDSLSKGRVRPIGQADFTQALREVRPSTRTWFESAKNYALFANENGNYDDLLQYINQKKIV